MFKYLNKLDCFFNQTNKEFSVREFSRINKISPATASSYLELFTKEKILQKRKERIYNLFKANIKAHQYTDLKIYYSIKKLRDSGLIKELHKEYLNPTIVLFGSTAQGLDDQNSDIDLCIITKHKKKFSKKKYFEKKLNKELQLFIVKKLSEIPNKHLISSIANGINLQGMIVWSLESATKKVLLKKQDKIMKE